MNERILIIEDEEGLVLSLEDRLLSEGYQVESALDGVKGCALALQSHFDCILLDVMLPGKDGFQVCKDLREAGSRTPVLMLTARTTDIDVILGLHLGADDYLCKPFDMQVLLARIHALLRRCKLDKTTGSSSRYTFGDFLLDTEKKELFCKNTVIPLNAQEYRLLTFFAENPGRIFSRDDLLDAVWSYGVEITTRTVDVHVAILRKKLNEQNIPRHILTARGMGYKFVF